MSRSEGERWSFWRLLRLVKFGKNKNQRWHLYKLSSVHGPQQSSAVFDEQECKFISYYGNCWKLLLGVFPHGKMHWIQHRYLPRQQLKKQQHQGLLWISFYLDCECCVVRKIFWHFSPIIHQLQGKPVAVGCLLPCGFSCHFPQVCEDTYRHRDFRSPF